MKVFHISDFNEDEYDSMNYTTITDVNARLPDNSDAYKEEIPQTLKYSLANMAEYEDDMQNMDQSNLKDDSILKSNDHNEMREKQPEDGNEYMKADKIIGLEPLENLIKEEDIEDVAINVSEKVETEEVDILHKSRKPGEYLNVLELLTKSVGTTQILLKELSKLKQNYHKPAEKMYSLLGKI